MQAERRKITVTVRRDHLEAAQAFTGKGVTETVTAALRTLTDDRKKGAPARTEKPRRPKPSHPTS